MLRILWLFVPVLFIAGCGTDAREELMESMESESAVEVDELVDEEVDESAGLKDAPVEEETPEVTYSYIDDWAEVTLNQRDEVLYSSKLGDIRLVGEKIVNDVATYAVELEGELPYIWGNIEPDLRLILSNGESTTDFSSEVRIGPGKMYMLYHFNRIGSTSVERFDYIFENDDEAEYEKLVLDEVDLGELTIPGIYEYSTRMSDVPFIDDEEKTVNIAEASFDSATGDLELMLDVTYHEDVEITNETYVYDRDLRNYATRQIREEFFAGVTKEVSLSYRLDQLSQYTPYVKLMLFDEVLNLKVFNDRPEHSEEMELVYPTEEKVSDYLFVDADGKVNDRVRYSGLPLAKDTKGNAYATASLLTGYLYAGLSDNNKRHVDGVYRIPVHEYHQFEATLSFLEQKKDSGDVRVYLLGDDFERDLDLSRFPKIKGDVIEELTVKADRKPIDVSADVKDIDLLTIYVLVEEADLSQNNSRIIISDGKVSR